jgi:hypothetical protein
MNKHRIQKKVWNMKLKGKPPGGRPRSRWKQKVRQYVTQKEGRTWEETWALRKKTDTWLTSNPEAACTSQMFAILPIFIRPMSKSYKCESTVMMAVKTALTVWCKILWLDNSMISTNYAWKGPYSFFKSPISILIYPCEFLRSITLSPSFAGK